ncbi:hypothetical protein [uncultured Gilvimarinus sp.]|uniref:hypothetical protein n=1 Tax=uncultured Gilvimarinus sp. TaxID=1689143 RepID=UPI0030EDD3DE
MGAYGNIGAVLLLTVFSFVETSVFFMVIAATIAVAAAAAMLLDEPAETMVEVLPDGSVQHVPIH